MTGTNDRGLATVKLCSSYYCVRISPYRSANFNELGDIKTPLTKFELRDERLSLPEKLAEFHLRYARILTSLHKQLDQFPVKIGTK